jgi:phosphatidate cytidylyltransferase
MLKKRIMTAVVLAVVVILLLFRSTPLIWSLAFYAVAAIAAWEWAGFAGALQFKERFVFVLLAGLLIGLFEYYGLYEVLIWVSPLLLFFMMMTVFRYQRMQGQAVITSPMAVLVLGLWTIATFTVAMVHFPAFLSPSEILLSMMAIWAIDTGAYFSGRRFGKTKLASYVSPGKTWEGVIGGGLFSFGVILIGAMSVVHPLKVSPVLFALLASLIALLSVFGDLFQSVLKRQAGLKDSGKILPGHGGVLDRIDSLLISMPLFYLLWQWSLM